jgi:hypothetical protein
MSMHAYIRVSFIHYTYILRYTPETPSVGCDGACAEGRTRTGAQGEENHGHRMHSEVPQVSSEHMFTDMYI